MTVKLKALNRAYETLASECDIPPVFFPPKDYRERPVVTGQLVDVEMPQDYSGEEIPTSSQKDTYYDDLKEGFSGVAIYSGKRHPAPARQAATGYAAFQLAHGNIEKPNRIVWRRVSGHGFKASFRDNDYDSIFQPDLLVIDAMYAESSVTRVEKIRAYLDLNARSTIILAAGLSPVDVGHRRLNVDFGRVLFFL